MRGLDREMQQFYDDKRGSYGTAIGADNAHAHIPHLVGSGRRVLDVGCGRGQLGEELRRRGNTVFGVEISPEAAIEARDRLDGVTVGSVEDPELALPSGPFDAIVCADILEHLFDPLGALLRITPLLADAGDLIVSLPNVAHFSLRLHLLFGRWEYRDIGLLDHGHIRFFTLETGRKLMSDAGLRMVHEDLTLSLPFASRSTRRVIDLCRRLPPGWQRRLAPLIAVQHILVARPTQQ